MGTVLAPTNDAFLKLFSSMGTTAQEVARSNPSLLEKIVKTHIVPPIPKLGAREDFFTLDCRKLPTSASNSDLVPCA
jgi:hypothetical protein